MGSFVMRIWEKKEDGGWDVSGATFCACLWDLSELRGKVERVLSECLNKRA